MTKTRWARRGVVLFYLLIIMCLVPPALLTLLRSRSDPIDARPSSVSSSFSSSLGEGVEVRDSVVEPEEEEDEEEDSDDDLHSASTIDEKEVSVSDKSKGEEKKDKEKDKEGIKLSCTTQARYKDMLCSPDIVEAVAKRSYYDYARCSPNRFDLACLPGFFSRDKNPSKKVSRYNMGNVKRCCPGHYCPEGVVCMIPCSSGAYCPLVKTSKNGTFCEPYNTIARPYLGCGGAVSEFPCPEGNYCPDTQSIVNCPAGYYCPSGSKSPQRCPSLAVCPPLTVTPQLNFSGMALIFGILLPIILMTMALRCFHDRKFQSYLDKRAPGLLSKRQSFRLAPESSDPLTYPIYDEEKDEYTTGDVSGRRSPRPSLLPTSYDVYRINIVMDNLAVSLRNHRMLLQGASGCFRAGRMTAVMGPSGAGKSVLLSVIAGRLNYGQISGRIYVNNSEGIYALKKYKEVVGFVPQEDVMHRNLTVYENLAFNANWRLPSSMSARERKELLFGVLDVLGLPDHILQNVIGDDLHRGISGGERKRVNIGMEIVAQPSVLLLDEPTTGLDASTCLDVVQALKVVAESGVNVIVVLHQPRLEILELFDDLLLLAAGGRTAYTGPINKAIEHFSRLGYVLPPYCNPADFYMDILSGRIQRKERPYSLSTTEYLLQPTRSHSLPSIHPFNTSSPSSSPTLSPHNPTHNNNNHQNLNSSSTSSPSSSWSIEDENSEPYVRRKQAGFFQQCWLCTKRALAQRLAMTGAILTDYSLMALAGLVMGLLFNTLTLEKVPSVNMFISMAIGFAATQQSLRLFGMERAIFLREANTGLDCLAYFIGKQISSIPDLILLPFTFLSMYYAAATPRGDFMAYYASFLVAQFLMSGVGNLISVVLDPTKSELTAVVLVLILNSISGFSPVKSDFGRAGFIVHLSYGYWLMETLFVIESERYPGIFLQKKMDIANLLSFDLARGGAFDLTLLFGVGIVVRVLNYLALRWGVNR